MANDKKLGLVALIALVIGSMIGGGVFNISSDMVQGASPGSIIVGWVITGIGMIALALSFQNLSMKRPDLDSGVYSYAKEGFGSFMGFNSAWGYWVSAWLGNIAYATLVLSAIGYFFPTFEGGQNIASIIGASILLWGVHFLILRGVKTAALVNIVTTIAKLIPVFLFIIIAIFAFNIDKFSLSFWGDGGFSWSSVASQVKSTMLVTLWVFIGVEGAIVLSGRAKERSDIGKATVLGLICTLILYILITILPLGYMNQAELAGLKNPAMANIMEAMVGKWGAIVVNLGLIVSVLGAWLGWTMFAAEVPFVAAKDGVFPKWFAKENSNGAPVNALWLTNGLVQAFLITFLFTDKAYNFMFSLASSAILIPYAFSAFYQLKHSVQSTTADRVKNLIVGSIASLYAVWLVYAAGIDYLLLTMVLYAPGILVFYKVQRQTQTNLRKIFSKPELVTSAVIIILAVYAIFQLAMGAIQI